MTIKLKNTFDGTDLTTAYYSFQGWGPKQGTSQNPRKTQVGSLGILMIKEVIGMTVVRDLAVRITPKLLPEHDALNTFLSEATGYEMD